MNKSINKKIILSFLVFMLLSNVSFAQSADGLVLNPENPGAFQDTLITLRSYSFDIDTVLITWYVDGKIILSGMGEKKLSIKTGGVGSQKTIHTIAMKGNQKVFDYTLVVVPQSVDLIWESRESYTPPFYEGKALAGESSVISVIALPNFIFNEKQTDPKTIAYAWYLNDEIIKESSGYNRQKLTLPLDYLSERNVIKVVARDQEGNISEKEITVQPEQIDPVFYLNDPLFGTDLNKAITGRFETDKEFTLDFVPYFLSTKNIPSSQIKYSWSLDGLPLGGIKNNSVSMRPAMNSSGSKILKIDIENTARLLQDMKTNLDIIFDTKK